MIKVKSLKVWVCCLWIINCKIIVYTAKKRHLSSFIPFPSDIVNGIQCNMSMPTSVGIPYRYVQAIQGVYANAAACAVFDQTIDSVRG